MEKSVQKLNFFTSAFLGIMGFSLIGELFMEDDWMDKIDDGMFLILGIAAIFWYKSNALKKSMAPIILVLIGVAIKIFAIFVEIKDKEAVGDDFGILSALLITLVVVIYQYRKLK